MENTRKNFDKLVELNEQLENYFRNTIIPQLFVDSELILRKFTPPAMQQFELKESDIGRSIKVVADNFRFPTFVENIHQVMQTGEILEKEVQTTDKHWFQMNILPYIRHSDNKANGTIITFVDITARIRDLKEQEKLIAEHELLLDTIAHDIKTPLTSLGLAIQLLKKLPEKGMDNFPILLGSVDSGLEKIRLIVDDLVKTRWTGSHYQADKELLDLQNILEDVRLTLSQQIKESAAKITLKLECSEIAFVRRKLRSIMYNLINNAIKYHSPERKPEIIISSSENNGFMVISVTDNGIGIAPAQQASIFEKFKRIGEHVEGNGVGLYLVKETLETAGGRIALESEPGVGSTFKIYLKLEN